MPTFTVRVNHELDFFTVYNDIEAPDCWEAEAQAKKRFLNDFCGGVENINPETGEKYKLETFTFDKYKYLK